MKMSGFNVASFTYLPGNLSFKVYYNYSWIMIHTVIIF